MYIFFWLSYCGIFNGSKFLRIYLYVCADGFGVADMEFSEKQRNEEEDISPVLLSDAAIGGSDKINTLRRRQI